MTAFLPGWFGAHPTVPETTETPSPAPPPPAEPKRTGVPTLEAAALDVRRDVMNTPGASPLCVVVNYQELLVILKHAEATVAEQ